MHRFDKRYSSPRPPPPSPTQVPWTAEGRCGGGVRGDLVSGASASHLGNGNGNGGGGGGGSYPTARRMSVQLQQRDPRRCWPGHHVAAGDSVSGLSASLRHDTTGGGRGVVVEGGWTPSSSAGRQHVPDGVVVVPQAMRVLDRGGDEDGSGCYYLSRGNGQVTRLIPADMLLPPLGEVPAREMYHPGMVVLGALLPPPPPPPGGSRPHTGVVADAHHELGAIKKNSDRHHHHHHLGGGGPVATGSASNNSNGSSGGGSSSSCSSKTAATATATAATTSRRHKVYCDKWIHEGVCAFTQQGCKFKHEMPFDGETQRSLGLFQGLPGWYRKSQDEDEATRGGGGSMLLGLGSGGDDNDGQVGRRRPAARVATAVAATVGGQVRPSAARRDAVTAQHHHHPLGDYDKMRTVQPNGAGGGDGPLVPYNWGPVGTPARKRLAGGPGVCIGGQHKATTTTMTTYRGVSTQPVAEFCRYAGGTYP
ncbi:hypothetical protein JDV02_006626 [Purpureocillium takamizusanense]|uniref:C3H1-type domain-containing protein n=1 Tax=Purpureocillium takamizusanense TaxID=2060973 RepID=A0A9Q8QIQ4_9HYPO|nr:uncharacterized protein JDV02_006626 [Purpureocillium takamizusanense]UNI20548.1 hypothetical protein JDV02_006626 [Purpureocillium takamizusanense]